MDVLIHSNVVYKKPLWYNFTNFMSIYIYVVPLIFDGRTGDLLVISYLAFPFFFLSSFGPCLLKLALTRVIILTFY